MSVSESWIEAYIGLGSNLDDPLQQIVSAAEEIGGLASVKNITLSPLYTSQPVGPQDQPDYVNAVMRIKTRLEPLNLLSQLQAIENKHGRMRSVRWGARTLDLDILLYDNQIINLADLVIPHPELANRAFVLYPLADIAPPDLLIPGNGHLSHLLTACPSHGLKKMNYDPIC
ncbi:2-amino-4-hydroxy-6-hydroxymethyldihydropteridine pyrophosphokinase [Methylomonas lenta]|uniref:2-amino-4-hydroxy-6-hydroxymethyldihydropteridine pyrophosphokinase n=1 Tax=Methylomonas lenta TaxID=980561 RepID=A0A177NU33_9GAMM|nr:2-amino-4-hydroxy-6-hydroxymethyldihydropteridine diphosphokinase [Methylomonas lenta]OAI21557.1 2-amino-4-hydroxy-6-hydroxymethyldihydropteridine pyrophosphokinase [Methylomonas lenta]